MITISGFKVVQINGNSHIAEEIEHAIYTGHLWVRAVPTVEIAGFKSTPNPTHLIFMDTLEGDAEAAFEYVTAEQLEQSS